MPVQSAPQPEMSHASSPLVAEEEDDDLPRPGKVWSGPSLAESLKSQQAAAAPSHVPAPAAPPAQNAGSSNVEPVDTTDLPAVWQALLSLMATQGQALHGILCHGRLVSIEEGRALIRYGPQHETFVKMLERNGKKDIVRDAMTRVLNQSVGVKFEVDLASAETAPPAARNAAPASAAPRDGFC